MDILARQLAEQFRDAAQRLGRMIVAIDGPGCCGKSTLCEQIATFAGAAILGTDDFHLPRGAEPAAGSPLPYRRWPEFLAAAEALASGRPTRFRPIDWETHGLGREVLVDPQPIVLIEGIGSMHASLGRLVNFNIWVDGLARSRMQRVALRNGHQVAVEWDRYVPFEQDYLHSCRPWRRADLWVYGTELAAGNSALSFSRLIEQHGSAGTTMAGAASAGQDQRQAWLAAELTRWANAREDLESLALIGSWARGHARADSDIDFMILVREPERFRQTEWLKDIDWSRVGAKVASWKDETYGAAWSRRLMLDDGTEVELSFSTPAWAAAEPFDAGTRRVLAGGCRVLHDRNGLLHLALRRMIEEQSTAVQGRL